MNLVIFCLISLSVVFNTIAQLAMKNGINKVGNFAFSLHNFVPVITKIIFSPWIIFGLSVYVASTAVWLMVLSRTPVSIAFPMSSLAYVTSAFAAVYFLGEHVSMMRLLGITIILLGVFVVAKS